MELAVPLSSEAVKAANRLHAQLVQWQRADRALEKLRVSCPDFGHESTLLKAVAINSLYGTNVLAIYRVADYVHRVMRRVDPTTAGPELVEKMARVPVGGTEKRQIRRHSFASKFAHFFVDSERFPILDDYAEKMVRFHLGRGNACTNHDARYEAYVENLNCLMKLAGLRCRKRNLDRYLWIAGQYRRWKRNNNAQINLEVRRLFKKKPRELKAILPDLP